MDTVEATKMVMSRIQKLDPEHASKIMGYILIQDQGDNEMIRLAFGPENHLVSVIKKAKSFLDISSNTSSANPQIIVPNNNGFHHTNPSSPSSPWSVSDHRSPRPASYAAVVNGGGSSGSSFFSNFNDCNEDYASVTSVNIPQVVPDHHPPLFDDPQTADLNGGFSNWGDDVSGEYGDVTHHHHHLHRRSCSVNDAYISGGGFCGNGGDDVSGGYGDVSGGGWRPCMYYAKGFCKNGSLWFSGCGGGGSPSGKMDVFEDLIRFKVIQQQHQQQQQQQQRFGVMGHHPFQLNRCMNFVNENPRSAAAAALMMGDEFHKFGRCRPDRNDFGTMGFGNSNSSSRQIYLTFPADSTFKEEDVSNYFSMFGPVQDVRIPYQQKRMFGFVTFMLPETVKAILAKGNPHFVCDSRVLVKPYKEKGKIPDKKHQQQIERGDFSSCLSPTALESAEPFDHIPFGARMFNHEMMIRRKIEEQELQQAIEFQDRRLMNLQLTDMKNHQFQRSLSVSLPTHIHQNLVFPSDGYNNEEHVSGGNNRSKTCDVANEELESDPNVETPKNESLEPALPDNLFASPTKSTTTDNENNFSADVSETDYTGAIPIHVTSKCQAIEM
ncbi:putative RNA recognition motif domain, nucleotide-binding alpha-beta plait domain superfamily [Helianthus annuus]|nr:putative RNA recognition motif domain, nucleotide-binding alpha-beta plait domain superfamily [Helianthus annuus]